MRVLLQRVSQASVTVEGETVGQIDRGLLLLVGIGQEDDEAIGQRMAKKVVDIRIFADEQGRTNRSLLEAGGRLLAVSQFTLYADTRRGRRPGFAYAADPEKASALFDRFCEQLEQLVEGPVERGVFGAMMQVHLVNDGPVTIMLDSAEWAG